MYHYEFHEKSELSPELYHKYLHYVEGGMSEESIMVRLFVLEYFDIQYWFIPQLSKNNSGQPIEIHSEEHWIFYWSISHSETAVAFIVADTPCWIDIIDKEVRNMTLLDLHSVTEYARLSWKNWDNFYILWSSKEALIKMLWLTWDDVSHITLIDSQKWELVFVFSHERYTISTIESWNHFISYTHSHDTI